MIRKIHWNLVGFGVGSPFEEVYWGELHYFVAVYGIWQISEKERNTQRPCTFASQDGVSAAAAAACLNLENSRLWLLTYENGHSYFQMDAPR